MGWSSLIFLETTFCCLDGLSGANFTLTKPRESMNTMTRHDNCTMLAPLLAFVIIGLLTESAGAAVVIISNASTANMSFSTSTDIWSPTAAHARLNVLDLENQLAASDVIIATGSATPSRKATSIYVDAALSWTSNHSLNLQALYSILVRAPIVVAGSGNLVLNVFPSFGNGSISFLGTANGLTINGRNFILESSVKDLGSAIAANPAGNYALSTNYNAGQDGTYASSPIATGFSGIMTGLGNKISNLKIASTTPNSFVGLFSQISGSVENLHIQGAFVRGGSGSTVGGLAAVVDGSLSDDSVSGKIFGQAAPVGGLAGVANGSLSDVSVSGNIFGHGAPVGGLVGVSGVSYIDYSYSTASISGDYQTGGLVGQSNGNISSSFATGAVVTTSGHSAAGGLIGVANSNSYAFESYATGALTGTSYSALGGLVGANSGRVGEAYATGSVSGTTDSEIGGLVGYESGGSIDDSYAIGAVTGGAGSVSGGVIGYDNGGSMLDMYWDTTTSGQNQGAGNIPYDPNITGLTTSQLLSGLPVGFSKGIWEEKTTVNGGFPYLLTLPPK